MAYPPQAHGRPQVIQGRFPGGGPVLIQPKPTHAQPQRAAHVQEAIHRGAPQFYRLAAQRKAKEQARIEASTNQLRRQGNATLLPATFHFAPSIGQLMPPAIQRKMETFFEADFSDVRIHVGPQAQQIGAQAFTMGSDIYFAPGQYMPHHSHGQRLLGHELAHVVQQWAGRVRNPFGGGLAVVQDQGLEAEAERMGSQAAHQGKVIQKSKRDFTELHSKEEKETQEKDTKKEKMSDYRVGWHQSPENKLWYYYYGNSQWSSKGYTEDELSQMSAKETTEYWEKYLKLTDLPRKYKDGIEEATVKKKTSVLRVVYPLKPNRKSRPWLAGWNVHLTLFSLPKDADYRFETFHVTYVKIKNGKTVSDHYRLPNYEGVCNGYSNKRHGLSDESYTLSDTFAQRFIKRIKNKNVQKLKESDIT